MIKENGQSGELPDQYERLKLGLDLVEANIMLCDADLKIVFANRRVLQMFADSREQIRAEYADFDPAAMLGSNLLSYHRRQKRSERILRQLDATFETDFRLGDTNFRIVVNPIFSASGERLGAVVEWQNLTAERLLFEEAEWQRKQAERVLDSIGDLRIMVSGSGTIVDVNRAVAESLGYEREQVVGTPIERLLPRGLGVASFRELAVDGMVPSMRTTLSHADGHAVPVDLFGLIHVAGSLQAAEVVLIAKVCSQSGDRHGGWPLSSVVADCDGYGVAVVDGEWRLVSVNRPFVDIVGGEADDLIGRTLGDVMPGMDDIGSRQNGDNWRTEYEGRYADGGRYTVVVGVHALSDSDATNRVITLKDVTDVRTSERRMRELAYNDTLTGVANRIFFEQQVRDAIRMAARTEERFAILFFDMDGFKEVNDTMGHAAGDRLLQTVAGRLGDRVRQTDLVARLGGDEFCILLRDIRRPRDASRIADNCLKAVSEPVNVSGRALQPRASAGITMFPEDGENCADLLRAADRAMYTAKRDGKNRYAFYRPEMTEAAEKRLGLERQLRAALDRQEFIVRYQPQVDLRTGRVIGFEALARWQHPQRGVVGPVEFMPVLEQLQLIEQLDVLVLREVCRQLQVWQRRGIDGIVVGINIAADHFRDGRIVRSVREAIDDTGIGPSMIELEMKEAALHVGTDIHQTCAELRQIGVRLAIDDFGSGLSCLETVRRLPLGRLKINRSYVKNLSDCPDSAPLVATIVALGRTMGARLVAEGIEELKQIQQLCSMDCEVGQGFYFGEAAPPEDVPAIVDQTFLRPLINQAR